VTIELTMLAWSVVPRGAPSGVLEAADISARGRAPAV